MAPNHSLPPCQKGVDSQHHASAVSSLGKARVLYSVPTGRIFMKFDIRVFFYSMSGKFEFYQNLTRITGTLHEDQQVCIFVIVPLSKRLRMRSVSDKRCREKQNTYFMLIVQLSVLRTVVSYSKSPFEILTPKPAMFTNGFRGLSKYIQVNAFVVFEVRSGTLSSNPSSSN